MLTTNHCPLIPVLGHGVVTLAGLDFVRSALGTNLDFAIAAVELGIAGRVAKVVLAAQFVLDLVEGLAQFLLLIAHLDDAAAGLFGQFAHVARSIALIPAAAIGNQDHVADGVGLLRGFDSVLNA